MQIPQKRVTKLINHHKVAAFPPQLTSGGPSKLRLNAPKRFPVKWTPVRGKKTPQNKNLELPQLLC